ncbi:ankyrin repeat domain-containing protein [Acidovorax sp. Leaf78]|uniref:ankyrin repeat domain-containing protein n=1 Tax=Acidovorax sp. Leaf78 TaxID=1736237 RepID=UPI0006F4335D|nr:ankyrin repeat domain-containing protein [Acidovorax sp. Leaf78]KQO19210.1 hypothetical protein ASF16_11505 [Acidovorax sp. Leaf78]
MKNTMGRAGALVFSAIFAVAFGLGGYFFGLKPLAQTLWTAWQVGQWQQVPAQVISAELKRHPGSKGGTTYEVQARYRYEFNGARHEGTRVGLDAQSGSDNIGDWHQQWHGRLQQAQARDQPITVRVNPDNPAHSLIDSSIRWRLQIFRLPFALIFTAVGVVAACVFVLLLIGRGESMGLAQPAQGELPASGPAPRNSLHGTAVGAWIFSLLWCGLSFPMAALLWSDRNASGWAQGFIGVFVLVGVLMLGLAIRQTRMVWRYRGSAFTSLPQQPQAGRLVEVTLRLTHRAAAQPGAQALRLRLAQYRVDESSSGSPERQVEAVDAPASLQPMPDGGLRLVARFEVPPDAPAHGAQRGRERVDWRVELLGADGSVELSYDLPVKAAPVGFGDSVPEDRFDPRAVWRREEPIAPPEAAQIPGTIPAWPAGAVLQELPQGVQISFEQQAWRWGAGIALAALAMEWLVNDRIGLHGVVLPQSWGGLAATAGLLAVALHAATRNWVTRVQDDGVVARCSSWMWTSVRSVAGDASQSLVHKVVYATGSGSAQNNHHAVYGRNAQGTLVQLTPALNGPDAAAGVGRAIAKAWQDRRGRFTPGARRSQRQDVSRPAWGWLFIGAVVVALWWAPRSPVGVATINAAGGAASHRTWSGPDGRLMDAQNAGDAAALEQALRDGANPNLLADNGSSMLMLAAHRGQMAHVNLLLKAGAQPDLRQTQKDSERGDTALLRAFWGGHLAVAQRLVQAGASLQARNRWDWGPVHMAAQSGCVPCLQWLADQGQPLDEPAPASRGETPAMLAAAKGRVAVLRWLEGRGVDLWRRDPHGKTALDWARFGQQADAERWLLERQR